MAGFTPNVDSSIWSRVSRGLGLKVPDTNPIINRVSEYGETVNEPLWNKSHKLAKEGSYFVVTNPTPGTGLATIATLTSLVDTSPFAIIQNNNPGSPMNQPFIDLDYIKLTCTAPGTAGTALLWAIKTDIVNRYTSGGSQLTGGVNVGLGALSPNTTGRNTSNANITAGALVAATPTSNSVRLFGHGYFRSVIPVVGDSYLINFGSGDMQVGGQPKNGSAPSDFVAPHAPVTIGPGHAAYLHIWLPSQSAASSFEIEIGYAER
jgi:hypothetical protein